MSKQRCFIEQAFALPRVVGALFCTTLLVLAVFSHQGSALGESNDKLASLKNTVEHQRQ